jgi:hypothetical protein
MGECMYGFMYSWSRHQIEVSGQLHDPAALSPRNENNIVALDIRETKLYYSEYLQD